MIGRGYSRPPAPIAVGGAGIDDGATAADSTWSSARIFDEIAADRSRLAGLEGRYVDAYWFAAIASGTSGTLAAPAGGAILLDRWPDGVDCLVSAADAAGVPTWKTPVTASGSPVTGTLGADGGFALSGAPDRYPVALVYAYRVRLQDFDLARSLAEITVHPVVDWLDVADKPATFPPGPHGHELAEVAGLPAALDAKEPAIGAKGTAFNRSFGTTSGSVCEGDDARLSDARAPLAHGHAVSEILTLPDVLAGKAALNHNHDALYAALAHVGAGAAAHALATASAAGFVSAYEEGAWTPVLAGDGAAGSNAYDAANTGGRYVRVGRLVFIHGRAKVTAVSGMTGNLVIKGLPFALAAVGSYGHAMTTSGINGLSGVTAGSVPVALLANGAASIYLQTQSNAGLTLIAASQCVAGTDVYITGSYIKG